MAWACRKTRPAKGGNNTIRFNAVNYFNGESNYEERIWINQRKYDLGNCFSGMFSNSQFSLSKIMKIGNMKTKEISRKKGEIIIKIN